MTFWGKALVVVTAPATAVAGLANGAYKAMSGTGTFDEGASLMDTMVESVENFGDKHNDHINKTAITVAGMVTGNEIKKHRQ